MKKKKVRVKEERGNKDIAMLEVTKEEQFRNEGHQQCWKLLKDDGDENKTSTGTGYTIFAGHFKQENIEILKEKDILK